ncbi:hypothetical protein [Coprobacter tertius]|uniref:Uncharacterized protein n=1 Tax=Coprobacter tertius TaxID=2944915 RepID=A0ABT1MII2_9BACT|nr:hypothetical protein [Coprobacter tertius]MCP9612194.1 hypothetical protein [Coprobacter tertius]
MKYFIVFFFSASVIFCDSSAAQTGITKYKIEDKSLNTAAQKWMETALWLSRRMKKTVENEEVPNLFTTNPELLQYIDSIAKVCRRDSSLQSVIIVRIPDSKKLLELHSSIKISEKTWDLVKDRFTISALISSMNSQEGYLQLAASEMLAVSHTYIKPPEWNSNLLFLLNYGSEFDSAVAFWQSGENTITGEAKFFSNQQTKDFIQVMKHLFGSELVWKKWDKEELKEL